MLLPQFHRDGQDRFERRFEITAGAVRMLAAAHHQPRSGFADPGGDRLHSATGDLCGGNVFDQHARILRERIQRPVAIFGRGEPDLYTTRRQQSREPGVRRGRDEEQRSRPLHPDQNLRRIVFGNRIIGGAGAVFGDLDRIALRARLPGEVAERQTVQSRDGVRLARRQDLPAAPQLVDDLLLNRRLRPGSDHKRFARRDPDRRVDLSDGQIVRRGSLQRSVINRDAARGGLRRSRRRIFARPAPVGNYQNLSGSVLRYQRKRLVDRFGQVRRVAPDIVREPRERPSLRRTLNRGGLPERNNRKAVVARHGAPDQINRLFLRGLGGLRHREAAVGDDDDGPVAAWKFNRQPAKREQN